jgi:class 3 adenylate cyclase
MSLNALSLSVPNVFSLRRASKAGASRGVVQTDAPGALSHGIEPPDIENEREANPDRESKAINTTAGVKDVSINAENKSGTKEWQGKDSTKTWVTRPTGGTAGTYESDAQPRADFREVGLTCGTDWVMGTRSPQSEHMHKPVSSASLASFGSIDRDRDNWTLLDQVDDFLTNSIPWAIFVCLLTIWALLIDDIKVLCLPMGADSPMFVINLCILGIFLLEFALLVIAQDGYAWSLAALMDFLAAISLIPFNEILEEVGGVSDSVSVARVARTARALRILRAARAATMALKTESKLRKVRRRMKNKKEISVLGDTLVHSTNIKVLLGILIMLMGTSLLDYAEVDRAAATGLELLDLIYGQDYLPSPAAVNAEIHWMNTWHVYRRTVEGLENDSLRRLMKLQIWGVTYWSLPTEDTRKSDLATFETGGGARSIAIVSKEDLSKTQAINSLILTFFSVFVIVLFAWSFRRDHGVLVIQPVKRMIALLKEMTVDPRKAMDKASVDTTPIAAKGTEIDMLEGTLGKLGALLKVGFGEAGMDMISRNIGQEHYDPVAPGVTVNGVFAFCDIRNFTDCCEVLNEDTLIFTNQIAKIVHGMVEDAGGHVNKNIGDAFLSVWKLNEIEANDDGLQSYVGNRSQKSTTESVATSQASPRLELPTSPAPPSRTCSGVSSVALSRDSRTSKPLLGQVRGAAEQCDAALNAFLKINQMMKSDPDIQELSADERLQRKLPGYTVRLGTGLHLGWAIEGAVGTPHKVDATYISPHVEMASRLEGATKQYGVSVLMSEASAGLHLPSWL